MGRGITWSPQLTSILGGEDDGPLGQSAMLGEESMHSLQMSNSLFAEVGAAHDEGGLLGGMMGSLINSGELEGLDEDGLWFEQSDHSKQLASSNHSSNHSKLSEGSSTSSFAEVISSSTSFAERAKSVATHAPPLSPRRRLMRNVVKATDPGKAVKGPLYGRFNDSDLDDLENSFFEETEVDYSIEDDVSQSNNVESDNFKGNGKKESDNDSGDDASSSSASSSEDEAIKQFIRDKMDGVLLTSPTRTIKQRNVLSSGHLPMDKILENACDDLSLMKEEDENEASVGSTHQEERIDSINNVDETREDIEFESLPTQESGLRGENSSEGGMPESAADRGGMPHQTDIGVWSDIGEKIASEQNVKAYSGKTISIDQIKAQLTSFDDKGDVGGQNNDSDVEGVVPPWIGFPPWGGAEVARGESRFRKCHGEYGYRGVYGNDRTTPPSKTFESIQRIQRFSQQPT